MTFAEIFQGATDKRGILSRIDGNGKKVAWQEEIPFDPEKHLIGKPIQGLSPVNVGKRGCRFICWDIDQPEDAKKFCQAIYKLDPSLFCFKSLSGRWHVYKFFDTWVNVDEAKEKAKALEKKIDGIGYECDKGHTLPQGYDLEKGKPGSWIFIPYSNKDTVCYSPRGNPLTKEQFEFRYKYRDHLLIAGSVGMAEKNGRHKALFSTGLYLKHNPQLDLTLEDINDNFNNSVDQEDIDHVKTDSLPKEEYDLEYLQNGTKKFILEITGVEIKDEQFENKVLEELTGNLVENYVYVRDRTDFFEKNTFKFADKIMLNDWYKHISKKKITDKLLEDPRLIKVHSYLTHAGLSPGVVHIKPRQIPGIEPGVYLNNYQGSDVVSRPGDVSKIINYFKWLVGESAWKVIEQTISYWIVKPGVKMMWAIVLISKTEGAGKQLLALLIASILGDKNVKTNVSFDMLINIHSTILEGKQVIVLNEVVMLGTGSERKLLANKLKPYISDPTLIINPKNKPMIEIPNLCNFLIFSNEENALHLTKDSRRYFVCNIKRKEEEILQKLEDEGVKIEILKAMKDPGPLKHHFEKEVTIENKDVFFSSAPKTEDLQEMIEQSKGDFERIMDQAYKQRSFPFETKVYDNGSHSSYCGLVIRDEFVVRLKRDPLFKDVFWTLTTCENWLKENCIPWPNEKNTKQIIFDRSEPWEQDDKIRRRAYLLHNDKNEEGKELKAMTEGELGHHYSCYGILRLTHEEIRQMDKQFHERTNTGCWNCKTPLSIEGATKCTKCNYGVPCKNCGKCLCENKSSETYGKDIRYLDRKDLLQKVMK